MDVQSYKVQTFIAKDNFGTGLGHGWVFSFYYWGEAEVP